MANATATDAMLALSGISKIATTSYSPKQNHPPMTFPPAASTTGVTAAIRSCGFLDIFAQASGV